MLYGFMAGFSLAHPPRNQGTLAVGNENGVGLGSGKGQQQGNGVLFHNLSSSNTQSRSLIMELVQKESAVQGIIGTSTEQILFWVLCSTLIVPVLVGRWKCSGVTQSSADNALKAFLRNWHECIWVFILLSSWSCCGSSAIGNFPLARACREVLPGPAVSPRALMEL